MATWILLADGSSGKILEVDPAGKDILEKEQFNHPQTAMKDINIHSSRPGRTFSRKGPLRHAIDLLENPKDHERKVFALQLADYLEKALIQNSFNRLIVVASHDMLGELRKALPATVLKTVTNELSKDLLTQNLNQKDLVNQIRKDLDLIHF